MGTGPGRKLFEMTGLPGKPMPAPVVIAIALTAISFSFYFVLTEEYRNYPEIIILLLILLYFAKALHNFLTKKISCKINYNYILLLSSLLVCLAGIEIYLRFFYQDNCDPPRFIPYHYRKLNETINEKNKAAAKKHPHGFRDEIWPLTKDPGVFRLAVLGDSFIWGDGLPYEQIWSQKLKQRLNEAYGGRVEVLSWGRKGWSTLDEYRFLKDLGVNYQPDLLIVGYVSNDPDLGLYPQEYFNLAQVSVVRPLRWLFPNTVYFVSILCESWANKFFALGYANWEEKLYHPENLREYSALLLEFSHFCRRHHITLLLVHTPRTTIPPIGRNSPRWRPF